MEKNFKRTTVTSALPYANGPVHIGHLAGVYVPADIYVRYLRLKKEDVLFIGGSDEHGVPITIRAKKEGITPQDVVDRYHFLIKKSFEEFGISFDVYSRTSSKTHHELASDFFKKLYEKGEFRKLAQYITKNEKTQKKYVEDGVLDHKIKEASFSRSRNMPLPEPETDILYRWQKEPRPKKGYYIVKDTYFEGINKATGFPYRHYEMIRIRRTEDEESG